MNTYRSRPDGGLYEARREDGKYRVCPAGGGFSVLIPAAEFERFYEPAEPAKPSKALVVADFVDKPIPAYVGERRWNGWVVPYFERDALLEAVRTEPGLSNVSYDAAADEFVAVMDDGGPGPHESERYGFGPVDTAEGVKELCGLGAGGWCWELV